MQINQEIRDRITAAADQLFNGAGRVNFPTVDAVRRASKTSMNDASAVMKDWRRMQTATAEPVAQAVPDRVQQASAAALAAMWHEAQEIANENLKNVQAAWDAERAEADVLRNELSTAFEGQAVELATTSEALDALDKAATASAQEAAAKLDQAQIGLAAMTERAITAEARVVEIEKRANDLKDSLIAAQEAAHAIAAELATVKAKAVAAEQEAAVLAAKLEAMTDRATKAEARADQAEKQVQQTVQELSSARAQVQTQQAGLDAAARELDDTRKQIKEGRADAKKSGEEAAELRGRLAAQEQIQTTKRS